MKVQHYKVLARAYRPQSFDALVGQDALVETLTKAIAANRIPHAFMFSGPRGVGKTTSARLIARALNCIGSDGQGQPTMNPCGQCEHCTKIADDCHIDVIEMDAASRTGVEDVRELIEGVRYKPVLARYKIYIIDEVHMLSKHAFNAFLKTLEEPPAGVVFIFATTELRKVPVTVLSRCMRFDLKLVPVQTLKAHLIKVATQENVKLDDDSAILLAQASGGSVRDALSLLDQAIIYCSSDINSQAITSMLGLADRIPLYQLVGALLSGDVKASLSLIQQFCALGLDPKLLLQDLLQVIYTLMRLSVDSESLQGTEITELDRTEAQKLQAISSIPKLGAVWQMVMKGLEELKVSDNPYQAIDMIAIRVSFLAPFSDRAPASVTAEKIVTKIDKITPQKPTHDPLVQLALDSFPDAKIISA